MLIELSYIIAIIRSSCSIIDEWQFNHAEFGPRAPTKNLKEILKDFFYVDINDVLGSFSEELPSVPIGQQIARHCVLLSREDESMLYDIVKDAPFCGVYDNTSDNPDIYVLKIITVSNDGKGMNPSGIQRINKVAAHSKYDVSGLLALVNDIDGDMEKVATSSNKKVAACKGLLIIIITIIFKICRNMQQIKKNWETNAVGS